MAYALVVRAWLPPVVCDDAFITLRTAYRAAHGGGLAFNPGQPVYVVTTPLWALLLALLQAVGLPPLVALTVLGAASEALLAAVVVELGVAWTGRAAVGLLGAVLLFANPVFVLTSHSGLELPLDLAAIAAAFLLLARGRDRGALVVAALAVWVRVDAVALVSVVALAVLFRRPRARLAVFLPALLVLTAYLVFGLAVYHQVVPESVHRKLASVAVLRPWWREGVIRIAAEFVKTAFFGRSAYWYAAPSPMPVTIPAFVAGAVVLWRTRPRGLLSAVLFTVVYVGAFVLSGATSVENYPWYFAPPLVLVAVLAAAGGLALVDRLLARPGLRHARLLAGAPALLWALCMSPALARDRARLIELWSSREGLYAAASTCLSRRLPADAVVAANEIGTIGWYARPDVSVLDLYGLALPRADRALSRPQLIERRRPHAILMRALFAPYYPGVYDAPGYRWVLVDSLAIGARADLADAVLPKPGEIQAEAARVRIR
ncbi:MAG: hypothetical protein ACHQ52_08515 [Candidatus Eisenbacteria bacterium]